MWRGDDPSTTMTRITMHGSILIPWKYLAYGDSRTARSEHGSLTIGSYRVAFSGGIVCVTVHCWPSGLGVNSRSSYAVCFS